MGSNSEDGGLWDDETEDEFTDDEAIESVSAEEDHDAWEEEQAEVDEYNDDSDDDSEYQEALANSIRQSIQETRFVQDISQSLARGPSENTDSHGSSRSTYANRDLRARRAGGQAFRGQYYPRIAFEPPRPRESSP